MQSVRPSLATSLALVASLPPASPHPRQVDGRLQGLEMDQPVGLAKCSRLLQRFRPINSHISGPTKIPQRHSKSRIQLSKRQIEKEGIDMTTVPKRGTDLLRDPSLNKSTAFTEDEKQ